MTEVVEPPLFDNTLIEALVVDYQNADNEAGKIAAFQDIAIASIPVIHWVSKKSDWLSKINETDINAIVSEMTIKLPKLLDKFVPGRGTKWFSYFVKSIENKFRHWNRGLNVRAKYSTPWPVDEYDEPIDIIDSSTVKLNSLETEQQKYIEFERARFILPLEVAETLPQPYQNLVRFIAKRHLDRADNKENLFISELVSEVEQLPLATEFGPIELDNLVRLSIASIRSNLYHLREELTNDECELYIANLLEHGDPKLFPLLAIFDPVATVKLLFCLAGVHPAVPPQSRFIKR